MVVFKNKSFQLEMPNEVHTGQVTQCLEFSLKFYSKKESKSKKRGEGEELCIICRMLQLGDGYKGVLYAVSSACV